MINGLAGENGRDLLSHERAIPFLGKVTAEADQFGVFIINAFIQVPDSRVTAPAKTSAQPRIFSRIRVGPLA
jgi:hypothetical protein